MGKPILPPREEAALFLSGLRVRLKDEPLAVRSLLQALADMETVKQFAQAGLRSPGSARRLLRNLRKRPTPKAGGRR